MTDKFAKIHQAIIDDPMNAEMKIKGYTPVYTAGPRAKIILVGQAPGVRAQTSMKPWNDASGILLRKWLGVSEAEFYDPDVLALIPMDFFYPGKAAHGDLPPRKGFAEKWHPELFSLIPDAQLIILVGAYAQKYYLGRRAKSNLTETIRAYEEYAPKFFPLVHPSPLNFRWRIKNPWFETEIVPQLQTHVRAVLER